MSNLDPSLRAFCQNLVEYRDSGEFENDLLQHERSFKFYVTVDDKLRRFLIGKHRIPHSFITLLMIKIFNDEQTLLLKYMRHVAILSLGYQIHDFNKLTFGIQSKDKVLKKMSMHFMLDNKLIVTLE